MRLRPWRGLGAVWLGVGRIIGWDLKRVFSVLERGVDPGDCVEVPGVRPPGDSTVCGPPRTSVRDRTSMWDRKKCMRREEVLIGACPYGRSPVPLEVLSLQTARHPLAPLSEPGLGYALVEVVNARRHHEADDRPNLLGTLPEHQLLQNRRPSTQNQDSEEFVNE